MSNNTYLKQCNWNLWGPLLPFVLLLIYCTLGVYSGEMRQKQHVFPDPVQTDRGCVVTPSTNGCYYVSVVRPESEDQLVALVDSGASYTVIEKRSVADHGIKIGVKTSVEEVFLANGKKLELAKHRLLQPLYVAGNRNLKISGMIYVVDRIGQSDMVIGTDHIGKSISCNFRRGRLEITSSGSDY